MKKITLILAALTMTGCATEAVLPSQAKQAPSERLLKYQEQIQGANSTLIVVRDKGFLGGGCYMGVYLNNEKSAILDPGEKATFYLNPGEWNIAMKGEGKVCIADEIPVGRDIQLKEGQTKAVRLFSAPSGNLDIKPLPL